MLPSRATYSGGAKLGYTSTLKNIFYSFIQLMNRALKKDLKYILKSKLKNHKKRKSLRSFKKFKMD